MISLRPEGGPVKATVLIRPEGGILDPQGQAVREALRTLGFPVSRHASDAWSTSSRAPTIPRGSAALDRMSHELLANPLIESFSIEIGGEA